MTDAKRIHNLNDAIALIECVIDDILMDAHRANKGPLSASEIARQTSLFPSPYHAQFITCVAKIMEQKGCVVNHGGSPPRWTTTGTLFGRDVR